MHHGFDNRNSCNAVLILINNRTKIKEPSMTQGSFNIGGDGGIRSIKENVKTLLK